MSPYYTIFAENKLKALSLAFLDLCFYNSRMKEGQPQRVYILAPVRQATQEQTAIKDQHVQKVKDEGDIVFNPMEDAPQQDPTGYNIVMTELPALYKAAQNGGRTDILWNLGGIPSECSRVDLGMTFSLELEYRLVTVFNKENPTGPQVAYKIISGAESEIKRLNELLADMVKKGEAVIDWDIEMATEEQEWQRIKLGLALGCVAKNPNFKIKLGELRGEDPPDKKSYPKVMREIERRQSSEIPLFVL